MSLISLLIIFIIMCLVIWIAKKLLAAFSIDEPIATVIYVVIVVLAVLWALQQLGFGVPFGSVRFR